MRCITNDAEHSRLLGGDHQALLFSYWRTFCGGSQIKEGFSASEIQSRKRKKRLAINALKKTVTFLSSFMDRHFLWLLLGGYAAAAVAPGPGLWIRDVSFGKVSLFQQETRITLPMLMLALLLLNAGLGIPASQLKGLPRIWLVLLVGLVANLLIPVAFIFGTTPVIGLWLDPDEVQSILVGLALIAAMPIAGSSTAWSQNIGGDLVLSLGLVVLSTLLSPLTTPVILRAVGLLATEDHAEHMRSLSAYGAGLFLMVCVVVPSILGILLSSGIGEVRLARAKPHLKLLNWINLLLLIYANASVSLPQAIAYPDLDFLLTTLGSAVALCVLAFGSGWVVAHMLGVDPPQQTSLMFGLGMNNNGTGLVLASVALAGHPRVMLPIIIYNLVQHLVAGVVAFLVVRAPAGQEAPSAGTETGSAADSDNGRLGIVPARQMR
jgi:BASS family bile acid:Na+ symporter